MVQIETGKELKMENVLSLRKKMTQMEIQHEMMKIGKFFEENGIKKNGPVVTATFAMEQNEGQPLLDMEILIPMDKKVSLDGEYILKEKFHLVNAVYARHIGNPNLIQNTYNQLTAYINDNKLHQITVGYNAQIKDMKPGDSIDEMVMDVFIGINTSTL